VPHFQLVEVDPLGSDALALLREAAFEARALYPELLDPDAPWPTNAPTPQRGVYLVAYKNEVAVACGAIRPIGQREAEVRRMFVSRGQRRSGAARAILEELEARAFQFGYSVLRLETGNRQLPAMALYESCGFKRIPPFGEYADDRTSVCYEKVMAAARPRAD
jgi:GNAT superfamily N-acetyltransferase